MPLSMADFEAGLMADLERACRVMDSNCGGQQGAATGTAARTDWCVHLVCSRRTRYGEQSKERHTSLYLHIHKYCQLEEEERAKCC